MYKFFRGYIRINVRGRRTERFLNIIAEDKIVIWNVGKIDENKIEFYTFRKYVDYITEKSEISGLECEITGHYGFLEELKRLKKRWMFAFFVPSFLTVLFLCSSVIWSVDVPDVDYIDRNKIKATLCDVGIGAGKIKYNIDVRYAANYLLMKHEELIWANVEFEGTRVKVTLEPRDKKPQIVDKNTPCNIVSKKDGYIIKIIAENGDKAVKVGDAVIKGQLLISGIVQSNKTGGRYVHAQGEVMAETWTEKTKAQKLYEYEKNYTGRRLRAYEISFGEIKIPLYFKKNVDFYNYDSIIKESNILFFKVKKYEFSEYTLKKKKLSIGEAVKMCSETLFKEIEKETQNIKNKKITYEKKDEETIEVRVFVRSVESIGEEAPVKTDIIITDKK